MIRKQKSVLILFFNSLILYVHSCFPGGVRVCRCACKCVVSATIDFHFTHRASLFRKPGYPDHTAHPRDPCVHLGIMIIAGGPPHESSCCMSSGVAIMFPMITQQVCYPRSISRAPTFIFMVINMQNNCKM